MDWFGERVSRRVLELAYISEDVGDFVLVGDSTGALRSLCRITFLLLNRIFSGSDFYRYSFRRAVLADVSAPEELAGVKGFLFLSL
jgi:hypothetical protein